MNDKRNSDKNKNYNKNKNYSKNKEYNKNKNYSKEGFVKKDKFVKKDNYVKKQGKNKEEKFEEKRIDKRIEKGIEEKSYEDQVEGRNSVFELLESGKDINKIYITKGEKHGSINKIIGIAKERKIIMVEKDKRQMNEIAENENHQGVIAIVPPYEYSEVEDILNLAKSKNEDPFIIILDGIEDPHNLGSIIRTAETAGVHGVIIPKRRAVQVNSTVSKVSAGGVQHMKIARVTNISDIIGDLKEEGLWICGTDIDTDKFYYNQDLTGPLAIVIGNEGTGMSEKVNKNCDFLVKIPMNGNVTSLNASVSAGIVMYEAVKQKNNKN